LKSQFAYPAITINVTPDQTHSSWINTANLTYGPDIDTSNNSSSTTLKWYNYWYGTNGTDWAFRETGRPGFVPGEGWDVEFATTDNNSGNDTVTEKELPSMTCTWIIPTRAAAGAVSSAT
jgi:hypothetical protein